MDAYIIIIVVLLICFHIGDVIVECNKLKINFEMIICIRISCDHKINVTGFVKMCIHPIFQLRKFTKSVTKMKLSGRVSKVTIIMFPTGFYESDVNYACFPVTKI